MNTRETALIGLLAALSSIVFCQFLLRAAGHHAQLSSAQIAHGLAICLAGVAVGLLLVLGASLLQEAGSGWVRSLGTFGLALGGALLLVLFIGRHPLPAESPHAGSTHAESTHAVSTLVESRHAESLRQASQGPVGVGTLLLAPGAWR